MDGSNSKHRVFTGESTVRIGNFQASPNFFHSGVTCNL
jgi:hypothetical protein